MAGRRYRRRPPFAPDYQHVTRPGRLSAYRHMRHCRRLNVAEPTTALQRRDRTPHPCHRDGLQIEDLAGRPVLLHHEINADLTGSATIELYQVAPPPQSLCSERFMTRPRPYSRRRAGPDAPTWSTCGAGASTRSRAAIRPEVATERYRSNARCCHLLLRARRRAERPAVARLELSYSGYHGAGPARQYGKGRSHAPLL